MDRDNELKSISESDKEASPFWQDILKAIWKKPEYEHEPDIVVLEEF